MKRGKGALFVALFWSIGCRTSTQVTVELTTDVDCSKAPVTEGDVGLLGSDVENRPASVATAACSPSGRIGSFVVVPSGGKGEPFAVKIVLAHGGRSIESCKTAERASTDFAGCIVARRALRFLPHTELTLPIALRGDCDGVICAPDKTCVRGGCVDAVIRDPGSCVGAGCPDPGPSPPDDGGPPDAAEERDVPSGPDAPDAMDGPDVPEGIAPPSCALRPSCGPQNESCCASPPLPTGTFRVHDNPEWPRTVSAFRLDRFEVTIGRFRRFTAAVDVGWRPPAGSGRHAHLATGGLHNVIGDTLESGWDEAWNSDFPKAGEWGQVDHLACANSIWTATPGPNENKPVSCVTWYQAYAFCIWDGGFLPSYTERNYAATGGEEQRPYPWGSDPPDLKHAQYCAVFCNADPPLLDVGSLSPLGDGRFGQADLAGNVWEWVLDSDVGMTSCKDCEFVDPAKDTRLNPGGGSDARPGDLPTNVTYDDVRTKREFSIGMRCARSP